MMVDMGTVAYKYHLPCIDKLLLALVNGMCVVDHEECRFEAWELMRHMGYLHIFHIFKWQYFQISEYSIAPQILWPNELNYITR